MGAPSRYKVLMPFLNHIGIAVSDPTRMERFFEVLGFRKDQLEEVPSEGVRTHFIPLPRAITQLELLEPLEGNQGAVAKFLEKRGPGVHHLSFQVENLEAVCKQLSLEGFRLIYGTPRSGAHSMRINFVHPASTGGILVELMEPAHS